MTKQDQSLQTRRHLGELGAMSEQTQRAERQILQRAEHLLGEAEKRMAENRAPAMAGDREASRHYQDAVQERGRLRLVIAQAKKNLGE